MGNVGVSLASPPDLPAMPPFPASTYGYLMTCALVYRAQAGDVFWWNDATWGAVTEWQGDTIGCDGAGSATAQAAYDKLTAELQQEDSTLEGQGIPVFEWAILVAPTDQFGDYGPGTQPQCGNQLFNEYITQVCLPVLPPFVPLPNQPPPNPQPNPNPNQPPPPNPLPQPVSPPCPPFVQFPDCIPTAPSDSGDDEVGQGFALAGYWLMVLAIYVMNIYQQLATATAAPGEPSEPDDCCAQVIAALEALNTSLTAINTTVANLPPPAGAAPIDLTAIVGQLEAIQGQLAELNTILADPPPTEAPPSDPSVDAFIQQLNADGYLPADLGQLAITPEVTAP